jgi:hypothetical protein
VRFLDFIYNGNHLFASKIDGQSAEGADGLTVCYQPSNLFANFLAAMRAGEREVDDRRDVGHGARSSRKVCVGRSHRTPGRLSAITDYMRQGRS